MTITNEAEHLAALERLQEAVFNGEPPTPELEALARAVEEYEERYFEGLRGE